MKVKQPRTFSILFHCYIASPICIYIYIYRERESFWLMRLSDLQGSDVCPRVHCIRMIGLSSTS